MLRNYRFYQEIVQVKVVENIGDGVTCESILDNLRLPSENVAERKLYV